MPRITAIVGHKRPREASSAHIGRLVVSPITSSSAQAAANETKLCSAEVNASPITVSPCSTTLPQRSRQCQQQQQQQVTTTLKEANSAGLSLLSVQVSSSEPSTAQASSLYGDDSVEPVSSKLLTPFKRCFGEASHSITTGAATASPAPAPPPDLCQDASSLNKCGLKFRSSAITTHIIPLVNDLFHALCERWLDRILDDDDGNADSVTTTASQRRVQPGESDPEVRFIDLCTHFYSSGYFEVKAFPLAVFHMMRLFMLGYTFNRRHIWRTYLVVVTLTTKYLSEYMITMDVAQRFFPVVDVCDLVAIERDIVRVLGFSFLAHKDEVRAFFEDYLAPQPADASLLYEFVMMAP